jgi:hypothetical protein
MRHRWWMPALLTAALFAAPATCSETSFAEGASVDKANWKQKAQAKKRYQQGMQAFEAGKYEDALKRFRQSYDVVASPNSHLMIARTLIRLKKRVDAYQMLDLVALEAEAAKDKDKYRKTAQAARAEQAQLSQQLAFVTVETEGVSLNGTPVPPEQLRKPIAMEPGPLQIVIQSESAGEQQQQVTLKAGETHTVTPPATDAPAPPAPAAQPPQPEPEAAPVSAEPAEPGVSYHTLGYISGGVGLAGMAAFTIFGLVNNSTYSDLEAECPDRNCPERLADTAESGRTYQTLANVGLGVGIVGVGTAVVLLLSGGSAEANTETVTSARVPQVVVGPRFVSVAGGF